MWCLQSILNGDDAHCCIAISMVLGNTSGQTDKILSHGPETTSHLCHMYVAICNTIVGADVNTKYTN